jgi:uncharacterized membrane protein SpoIIM required for sporulation
MSPLQFEAHHEADWVALAAALDRLDARADEPDAAGLLRRYRRLCEQLALARARAYPLDLIDRLDQLAQRAHLRIYRRPPSPWAGLRRLVGQEFPQAVRAEAAAMAIAALAFVLPMLVVGLGAWADAGIALMVMDADQLVAYRHMYRDEAEAFGRTREAADDWQMFGYYVRNNITVAFQCFATGLAAGVGSLFYLGLNGVLIGTTAGYLTAQGLGHNFWSFVCGHGALELPAIVIAGGAGLCLGRAVLMPGRLGRAAALRAVGGRCAVLIGGAAVMLLAAAVLEAFWSSARWVAEPVKYGAAAFAWAAVAAYIWRGGAASVATGVDRGG